MSDYRRLRLAGSSVFFTVCLAQTGSWLLVDEIERLRVAVRQTMAERPFGVRAWVVLPDHMHCIWDLPEGDGDFSVRWGAIKARFSMSLRRAGFTPPPRRPVVASGRYGGVNPALRSDRGEVAIWQRRFWDHVIRDEGDLATHLAYCLANPVRHGLVERAADWPHSSIHRDIRAGRVPAEWSGGQTGGAFGEQPDGAGQRAARASARSRPLRPDVTSRTS